MESPSKTDREPQYLCFKKQNGSRMVSLLHQQGCNMQILAFMVNNGWQRLVSNYKAFQKGKVEGFPGFPVVLGDHLGHQFDPHSWKIPHASRHLSRVPQLLSLQAATTETCKPTGPVLHNKISHYNKKSVLHDQRVVPNLCKQRRPTCSNEDPEQAKINKY